VREAALGIMPKYSKFDKCIPSTSSSAGVPLFDDSDDNDPYLHQIIKYKGEDFNMTRHEKLIRLSTKVKCQVR
jgi:histone acetyltransferase